MRSEDQVYAEYCLEKDQSKRDILLQELTPLLSKHAYSVVWIVLQESRPDIVNEALEAILRQLPKFKGTAKFSTYCEAIIRNIIKRKLRYHIKHKQDLPLEDVEPALLTEEKIHSQLDLGRIRAGLSSDDQILLDAQLEGASFREIQELLKLDTETAARGRWFRLKQKIVREMERDAG